MENEPMKVDDYLAEIKETKDNLDKAYIQWMDGAIMVSEFSRYPIALSYVLANFQVYIDLGNPSSNIGEVKE